MKAAEDLVLNRTVGDTDPFLMQLSTLIDGGTEYVPDAATVEMHIADSVTIAGTANGTSDGRFSFATTTISALAAGTYSFEVQVSEGGVIYTHSRGTIINIAQIA